MNYIKNNGCRKITKDAVWDDSELNHLVIDAFYKKAEFMTKLTGVDHHIDHIVPLQGRKVSGLHHYANLQILTADKNRSKGNRYV